MISSWQSCTQRWWRSTSGQHFFSKFINLTQWFRLNICGVFSGKSEAIYGTCSPEECRKGGQMVGERSGPQLPRLGQRRWAEPGLVNRPSHGFSRFWSVPDSEQILYLLWWNQAAWAENTFFFLNISKLFSGEPLNSDPTPSGNQILLKSRNGPMLARFEDI